MANARRTRSYPARAAGSAATASASASVPTCHAATSAACRDSKSVSAPRQMPSSVAPAPRIDTSTARPPSRDFASSRSSAPPSTAFDTSTDARTRPAPRVPAASASAPHAAGDRSGATTPNRPSVGTSGRSCATTASAARADATGSPARLTFSRASYHPVCSAGNSTADGPAVSRSVRWNTVCPAASVTAHCPINSSPPAPLTLASRRGGSKCPKTLAGRFVASATRGARRTDKSSNHALPRMSCANAATPSAATPNLSGCNSATSTTRNAAAGSSAARVKSIGCHDLSPSAEARGSDRAGSPTGLPAASVK